MNKIVNSIRYFSKEKMKLTKNIRSLQSSLYTLKAKIEKDEMKILRLHIEINLFTNKIYMYQIDFRYKRIDGRNIY